MKQVELRLVPGPGAKPEFLAVVEPKEDDTVLPSIFEEHRKYAGNPCSSLLTWNFPSVLNRYQTSRWENFEPKNEAEWTKLKRLAPYAASTAHVTPKGDDGIWK